MLFAGARYGAVLFVGVVIAEIAVLRSSLSWPIIIGIAGIIAVGYVAMTVMARRVLAFDAGLGSLRDVFLLLIGGGLGATIVGSVEHTSELPSPRHLVCRLLLEHNKTS